MGTSRSAATPSGGGWSQVKATVTSHFNGNKPLSSHKAFVSSAVSAGGGFGVGGGGGGSSGLSSGLGGAVSSLGGFGAAVSERNLDAGLQALGLAQLSGKSAVEVVAAIADHIASTCDAVDGELLRNAIMSALLEAAALDQDLAYSDLDGGLQAFLHQNGVEGLIEAFLCRFTFDIVWVNVEAFVQARSPDEQSFEAFISAVEGVCRDAVKAQIAEEKSNGTFGKRDWFGTEGMRVGHSIAASVQSRLQT